MNEVGVALAFSSGLLSFLSPCVLPLVPSYITFITGLSLDDVGRARRTALIHSLFFIAGFTLIFLALGAAATAIGQFLRAYRDWIGRLGGILIIVFGLYLVGAFNIGAFARERRVHLAHKPVGYAGTVLVGIAFGAGWTPCIGPILGSIFTYAASEADLQRGLALLFAYSMGLAVPFVLASVAVDRFLVFFTRIKRSLLWISRVSGVLLIAVGLLLVTNYFTILATWLQRLTPRPILERL